MRMNTSVFSKARIQKISLTVAVLWVIILFSCSDEEVKDENPFEGLWSLYIMEQKDSLGQWQEWRNGMNGYILYDAKDNMALHLTVEGYENTDLEFPNFNPDISIDALQHLTGSYVYFAKYEVDTDAGVVKHTRISHSNPGDWNKVVRRRFQFSGDTLILQPAESQNADLRLKWVKIIQD